MIYEISGILPAKDPISGEPCGGDAETVTEVGARSIAFKVARAQSHRKRWHEVQVRELDERGDISGHWYFKRGRLTWTMMA